MSKVSFGYALSSEEHDAPSLVQLARQAEDHGFEFALISDHFHPWIHKQGHSPFVWSVIGAIANATTTLKLGTGVTCPLIRTHPAVIAQASATAAELMPGRFWLGLGTGENLNEHITGDRWPPPDVRLDMLDEAIEIIRKLWSGDTVTHRGEHYTVEGARLYPSAPPPELLIAAGGTATARRAGKLGDGLVSTSPDREVLEAFLSEAKISDPIKMGQVAVCYSESEADARKIAHEWWPNAANKGQLSQELPMPEHFEQAAEMVTEDDVARTIVCGPDVEAHVNAMREFVDAGYDHVYVHQVGPHQDEFFRFYEREVLPQLVPVTT
jgi:coenzyme F420-dependent glucose-6-phosphate dehydrogenase